MNKHQINLEHLAQLKNKTGIRRILMIMLAGSLMVIGWGILPWCVSPAKASKETDNKTVQRIPVVVSRPEMRYFEKRIVTQGNIEARYMAMVSPRIPGTIEKIAVDEGDPVTAEQTLLFITDNVKLQQNVLIQKHSLAVAKCGHQQALANQEKVKADLDKADLDFNRFKRLLENGNTTQNAFEQQQSRYLQISAGYKLTTAQVALALEQVRQAEAALAIAQKDLADTKVCAPINGVISTRHIEPGEMGQPGKAVVTIVDVSRLEASAFLPAAYYGDVIAGKTPLRVVVSGKKLALQHVNLKNPVINPKLRTFEIKSYLENFPESIAPGAMADITVVLSRHEALGVPAQSVQTRGGQAVVFIVENDTARRVPVDTGMEMDGWVEIVGGNVAASHLVVIMGQVQLDDGSPVAVQKEGN